MKYITKMTIMFQCTHIFLVKYTYRYRNSHFISLKNEDDTFSII